MTEKPIAVNAGQNADASPTIKAGQSYYCEWYCSSGQWWPGNASAPPGYYCPDKPIFHPEPCYGDRCEEDPAPRFAYDTDDSAAAKATPAVQPVSPTAPASGAEPVPASPAAAGGATPAGAAAAAAAPAVQGFCCEYSYENGRFRLRQSSVPQGYYCPPDPIAFARVHGFLLTLPAPRAICEALGHTPGHT